MALFWAIGGGPHETCRWRNRLCNVDVDGIGILDMSLAKWVDFTFSSTWNTTTEWKEATKRIQHQQQQAEFQENETRISGLMVLNDVYVHVVEGYINICNMFESGIYLYDKCIFFLHERNIDWKC